MRINSFRCSTCNSDEEVALFYLDAYQWDVDSAVSNYKEEMTSNLAAICDIEQQTAFDCLESASWDMTGARKHADCLNVQTFANHFPDLKESIIHEVLMQAHGHAGRARGKLTEMQEAEEDSTCQLCGKSYNEVTVCRVVYCSECNYNCCSSCRLKCLAMEKENITKLHYSRPRCHMCKSKLDRQWERFPELFTDGYMLPLWRWFL